MTLQDKMARLDKARKKVDELTRSKERLSGALETKKAIVDELKEKARKDFDCEVEEIPDLVEKLDAEATAALEKAENLLDSAPSPADDDDEDALV